MRNRLTLLVLALVASLATGAVAQRPEPRIPDWKQPHLEAGNPATRSLFILAVCIRNHRQDAAEAMLVAESGSEQEAQAVALAIATVDRQCPIRVGIRIRDRAVLRGAVAEAIYNGLGVQPVGAGPLPGHRSPGASPRDPAYAVAACAVARNPRAAHAVVRFNPGMPGEQRALRSLTSDFLACLPEGQSLRATRLSMRIFIAEALLKASRAYPDSFRITRE